MLALQLGSLVGCADDGVATHDPLVVADGGESDAGLDGGGEPRRADVDAAVPRSDAAAGANAADTETEPDASQPPGGPAADGSVTAPPAADGGMDRDSAGDGGTAESAADGSMSEIPPAITDLCATPAGWDVEAGLTSPPAPFRQGDYVRLAFDVDSVAYARATGRFVSVSANPTPVLRVFDASGTVEKTVALSSPPNALSVAPNGKRAAVGHANAISLINLETGAIQSIAFSPGVVDLLDLGTGFLYAVPSNPDSNGDRPQLYTVEIATGTFSADTSGPGASGTPALAWDPPAHRIYVASTPLDARYDVTDGNAVFEPTPARPIQRVCAPLFIPNDGTRVLDGCGSVWRTSDDPADDLGYATSLRFRNRVLWAAHDERRHEFAVLFQPDASSTNQFPDPSQVYVFGSEFFDQHGAATLPNYEESGQTAPLQGQWLAYSADDQSLYAIAKTPDDSSLKGRTVLVTLHSELARDPSIDELDDQGPFHLLQSSVFDAQYSRSLERIIVVSSTPPKLSVLDPRTQTQTDVALPRVPLQLVLSPSGEEALVAFDGWLEYYRLAPLSRLRTLALPAKPNDTGLDDAQHVFSALTTSELFTADLDSGSWQLAQSSISGLGHFVTADHSFYAPAAKSFERVEVDGGVLGTVTRLNLDYDVCYRWWAGDEGLAFGACGHVFTADRELRYRGTLAGFDAVVYSNGGTFGHIDQSSRAGLVASVPPPTQSTQLLSGRQPSRQVALHEDQYLTRVGSVRLPAFSANGKAVVAFPRFAFFSNAGKRLDVLAQANPHAGIARDYGLISADLTQLRSCPQTPPERVAVEGVASDPVKLTPFDFDIVDATFSRALDRIVAVSSDPPRLRLIDPATASVSAQLALPLAATSVSLEAGGTSALVGHDGWLSRVALDPLALTAVHPMGADGASIASAGSEAYVVPVRDQTTFLRVLDLASGNDTKAARVTAGSLVRLSPDAVSLLQVLPENYSDADLRRLAIADAERPSHQPPLTSDYEDRSTVVATDVGHAFWFASDGQRLFGSHAGVFDLHDRAAATFAKLGSLAGLNGVRALDHSASRGRIIVVPDQFGDTEARLFDDASYAQLDSTPLPAFQVQQSSVPTHGRFIFFSADGAAAYVIVEATTDQPLASRFGLVSLPVTK